MRVIREKHQFYLSMVHFVQYFMHGEYNILLQADNCVEQNKNNTMINAFLFLEDL